ncbi:MAG: hypothetical protein RIB58_02400 [Phycisphaerales bacterium]
MADAVPPSANLASVAEVGAEELTRRTVSTLANELVVTGIPKQDVLIEDAGSILQAWFSGSGEDYLAYLAAADVPPPSPRWLEPGFAAERWDDAVSAMRSASFDPEGVTVRTTFRDGTEIPSGERYARAWGSRFDKISSISTASVETSDLQRAALTIHEVRIPMRMETIGGEREFDGLLGLSYGWDARRSTWALVSVTVYGVPNGTAVRLPPF